jgi:GrpB-like predicted nucleotidyltransferase (UPF0157 family)
MDILPPFRYQLRARQVYRDLARRLRRVLPQARIAHIGSSAVAGLWSKGDVDVFVGVAPERFAAAGAALAQLGFYPKADTLRTEQLCYWVVEGYRLPVAVQLVALGSRFEFFLTFRRRLRRHPGLRADYNRLKLGARALDEHDYRRRKAGFIQAVLAGGRRVQAARHC